MCILCVCVCTHVTCRGWACASRLCVHASKRVCVCMPIRVRCPSLPSLIVCACLYQGHPDARGSVCRCIPSVCLHRCVCACSCPHRYVGLRVWYMPCRRVFDAHARLCVGFSAYTERAVYVHMNIDAIFGFLKCPKLFPSSRPLHVCSHA